MQTRTQTNQLTNRQTNKQNTQPNKETTTGLDPVVWSCGPRGPDQTRNGPDRPRPDLSPFLATDVVLQCGRQSRTTCFLFFHILPMLSQKICDRPPVATSASSSWSTAQQAIAPKDAIQEVRIAGRCTFASRSTVGTPQRVCKLVDELSLPGRGGAGTPGNSNHIHGSPSGARVYMHLPSVCRIVGYTDVKVPPRNGPHLSHQVLQPLRRIARLVQRQTDENVRLPSDACTDTVGYQSMPPASSYKPIRSIGLGAGTGKCNLCSLATWVVGRPHALRCV